MGPLTELRSAELVRAKDRARRRRREGGAIMFIVATTLALLATMGVYALAAASTEAKTSGYVRQAAQAQYMAELAAMATAESVTAANADYFINVLMRSAQQDKNCMSAAAYDASYATSSAVAQSCWRFSKQELETTWKMPMLSSESLTPATQLNVDFFAEMTNPVAVQPPPGFDLNLGLGFARVTITTGGVLMPATAAASHSMQLGRARFVVGPIRK